MTSLALLFALTAAQSDRPTEDSMFGGPQPTVVPSTADGGLEEVKNRPTEEELFGSSPPAAAAEAQSAHPDGGISQDE